MPISEVYNVDCLEYMRSLPDKYFDLCIADPPFAIGISMNPVRQAQEERFRKECFGEIKQSNGEIITQNRLFDL